MLYFNILYIIPLYLLIFVFTACIYNICFVHFNFSSTITQRNRVSVFLSMKPLLIVTLRFKLILRFQENIMNLVFFKFSAKPHYPTHNLYTMLQKSGISLEKQLLKATSSSASAA